MSATAPHPYTSLPDRAYWRRSVSGRSPAAFEQLYVKKFAIGDKTWVATAGSCFAQHISAQLQARGFRYVDAEPRPRSLPKSRAHEFGYEIYSARFGNIYTPRQLLQLMQRATGAFVPQEDHWLTDGRWYDPFRPTIEPAGFASLAELAACRESHLRRVLFMVRRADVLVVTLGLTEAWVSRADGAVYPLCPGTHAGTFDPQRYAFVNFTTAEVLADLRLAIALMRGIKPRLRILFTVSPVPLVATASAEHVLVATTHSKSVLRAAAGELAATLPYVDYFPSYEIITAPAARGAFFAPDMREVTPDGVALVMSHFFAAHVPAASAPPASGAVETAAGIELDVVCDEVILAATHA